MSNSRLASLYSSLDIPESGKEPFTDYSRWRLLVNDGGRHTWHYLKTEEECVDWPQNNIDKYLTGQPLNLPALSKAITPLDAARNGYTFYKHIQSHDGHWAGEFSGPIFLCAGLVIGSYAAEMGFKEEERLEMIRYLMNRAHPDDGGWGVHTAGHSTVLGTVLCYVALRILGMSAEHPVAVKARATLHQLGGAIAAPTWAKFWLSVLNVYDWEGFNPVPPEFWLLPEWVPFHPSKWWVLTRNFYIPMGYLYAVRYRVEENDLVRSLREVRVCYDRRYTQASIIAFIGQHSATVSRLPMCTNLVLCFLMGSMLFCLYTRAAQSLLFEKPRWSAPTDSSYEDENTEYQTVASTSKMMNLLCRFVVEGPDTEAYRQHAIKRTDFMWLGAEGMMMSGTNGTQVWDIAFMMEALVETGLVKEPENKESLRMALGWLDRCQIRENPKHFETAYRHRTKGAWPFSTKEQGYTVSDTTGEGLRAVLLLQNKVEGITNVISDNRLFDTVDTLLSMQNPDGGFATYELVRGPRWLELLNMSDTFRDVMIEYCFPECTASVIMGLHLFKKYYPDYRAEDIGKAISGAIRWIHRAQEPDGGWLGSWGICFIYAARFTLEALAQAGGEYYANSHAVRRACDFLLSKQREDGGWGESFKTSVLGHWVEHENTQVVQTCLAAMALMNAQYPHAEPIERAVKLVMSRQLSDGSWPQEAFEGLYNKTCIVSYPNFKFSFTTWMLGRAHYYLEDLKQKDPKGEYKSQATIVFRPESKTS